MESKVVSEDNDSRETAKRKCPYDQPVAKRAHIERARVDPHFLTLKYSVQRLSRFLNIYDEQLRFHFRNANDLYQIMCNCWKHKHNRKPCAITEDRVCNKCEVPTRLMIDHKALLFHGDEFRTKNVYRCCKHVHHPPCNKCLNCNTYIDGVRQPCFIREPFECDIITEAVCPNHETNRLTTRLPIFNFTDHVYNIKPSSLFYLCPVHVHKHRLSWGIVQNCNIQTYVCCEKAVPLKRYDYSFVITVTEPIGGGPNNNTAGTSKNRGGKLRVKKTEYIVYDPRLWREQSLNHFVSFFRSVVLNLDNVSDRYARLLSSSFIINNLSGYMSGKDSVFRTVVIGFSSTGIYQTSTISCELEDDVILLPRLLYDLMRERGYFTDRVLVKRDPSITPTCTSVKYCLPHPDPAQNTIVVNDAIVKPMNQDQDGDKNAIYALMTRDEKGDDTTNSVLHRAARMEMSIAMTKVLTILAKARISISESGILLLARHPDRFSDLPFAQRTMRYGHKLV